MESSQKFSNSKEVIAFLAETFPNCFTLEGEAKPLKIGIFQDLAERLEVDLIGQVPMTMPMREGSDQGRPVMAVDPDNEASLAFVEMAKWVLAHAPSKRTHPELTINS